VYYNNLVYLVQVVASSLMLVHTSILDIRTREVDPKIWLLYSPLILFFLLQFHFLNLFIFTYSFLSTIMIFFAFYKLSMMGGADLFALLILGLANARVQPLLFGGLSEVGLEPLVVVLYASVSIVITGVLNLIRNLRHTKGLPFSVRLLLSMTGKRIKVRDFVNSKFLFPLTEVDSQGEKRIRLSFSIDEDDREWRDKYRELMMEGKLSGEDIIWVAWGVPVLPFIFLGYLLSIIIGIPIS